MSLCIALAALCAAFLTRIFTEKGCQDFVRSLLGASVLLVVLWMTRPPYLALSLILPAMAVVEWQNVKTRNYLLIAFVSVCFAVVSWSVYVGLMVSVPFGVEGVSYEGQVSYLIHNPGSWVMTFFRTLYQKYDFYLISFIGNLGYLDTPFPYYYCCIAEIAIIAALFYRGDVFFKDSKADDFLYKILVLGTIAITVVGIHLVLYISWTPVGNNLIEGVQGRYLIPVAFFIACILPENGDASEILFFKRVNIGLRIVLVLFAVVTLITVPWVVMNRYY
jgi:uncharacterized membrane protein